MYYPSLEQVGRLAPQGNLVPIYREINADLETPVTTYLKVARPPYSFLFESVEGGERIARFSFIGTEPLKIIKTGQEQPLGEIDPLVQIEKELSQYKLVDVPYLQRFNGGAVGYLSYDIAKYFEQLSMPKSNPMGLPESVFMINTTFLIFDHLRHKIRIVSHVLLDDDVKRAYTEATQRIDEIVERLNGPLKLPNSKSAYSINENPQSAFNISRIEYEDIIRKVKQYIYDGDIIQAVVSMRLARPTSAEPFHVYRALRAINPSPYMYYMNLDEFQIVGASPELLVQVDNGKVATHPIAGTRRRGTNPEEDQSLEQDLRDDEKERAEHIMLVDLGRNDIGRVSLPGTVKVTQLMDVERYSHVMHLVSHVTGELKKGCTNYDALRACFPAGTVSGAPKIRAMEIISELESDKRGPYAGAVGYFDFSGNMDTAITIRTLVLKEGVAYAQAGAGIVFDSIPEREYQEAIDKMSAVLRAIDQAEAHS